ncbi:cytochrome aa3 quinol oxidase subunit IV [Bacillaceae bacterium S4-13-58]
MANHEKHRFPINHVLGFFLSISMTILAMIVVFKTNFSSTVIMWFIGTLAFLQAGVQLFLFMHITEGQEKLTNLINIAYSAFLAFVIIIGSFWILTSGHAAY